MRPMIHGCLKLAALAAVLALAALQAPATAEEQKPDWKRCALDFVQNASDLSNLRLEVPAERLGPNAKLMATIIEKEGLGLAILQVHAALGKCAEPLLKGGRPSDPGELAAGECVGSLMLRLGLLGRIRNGDTLAVVELESPKEALDVLRHLHKVASEASFAKAAWQSLEGGLQCIQAARQSAGD